MTEMLINDKDIAMFSARLITFTVSGTAVTNNISAAGNVLKMPILYGCTLAPRTITVSLSFFPRGINGTGRGTGIFHKLHKAAENIIRFESELVGKVFEILLPDGYLYTCLYSGSSVSEPDATGITDVTYTFNGIRHLPLASVTVLPGGKVYCVSNTKTAFRLIMQNPVALERITIIGITVNNLPADSELIIDSVNGLITCNGENKFSDTDLIDFPYLSPGYNIISSSAAIDNLKVEYTPVFV